MPPEPIESVPSGGTRLRRLVAAVPPPAWIAAAAFVLAFLGALWLHAGSTLYDTDSEYHLAVARIYAGVGDDGGGEQADPAPPLRFSVLGDGFGDKEWLFHRLLAPLATLTGDGPRDALAGGRLALALLAALAASLVAGMAARPLGAWAMLLPVGLFVASGELAWRMVRLRPELLALTLFLAALWALGVRRFRVLGVVVFLFTLSYTAFHALLGLVGLAFLVLGWRERRWPWAALAYAALGAGLALVLHPHFPHNLEVWAVQNLQFFRLKGALDVGTEIRPNFTDVALMANLGWWLALAAFWRAAPPVEDGGREEHGAARAADRRLADVFGLGAFVFGLLYLLMSRFSIYFVPVATLWLLWEIRARGSRVGAWVRLPVRGRVPLAAALVLCLLVALPEARRQLQTYRVRTSAGPDEVRLADRERFSRAVPEGGRVAADWGATATYLLWAPQGRYLNVLDPVFMAVPHPERYGALTRVLDGSEPDVPLTVATVLDSEFLAFSPLKQGQAIQDRLFADPRIEPLYRGYHTLLRIGPPAEEGAGPFVLGWRAVPSGTPLPVPGDREIGGWPRYPRLSDPAARSLEGWVDGDRILDGRGECVALVRDREGSGARSGGVLWELAPHGPTTLWVDGEMVVRLGAGQGSVLGSGVLVEPPPEARRVTVLTCRAGTGGGAGRQGETDAGRVGFYLARRPVR